MEFKPGDKVRFRPPDPEQESSWGKIEYDAGRVYTLSSISCELISSNIWTLKERTVCGGVEFHESYLELVPEEKALPKIGQKARIIVNCVNFGRVCTIKEIFTALHAVEFIELPGHLWEWDSEIELLPEFVEVKTPTPGIRRIKIRGRVG